MCVLMGVWGQDGEEFVRLLFMIVREREREKERESTPLSRRYSPFGSPLARDACMDGTNSVRRSPAV